MDKHAYLIMPFNNFKILEYQISLLDYPGNDIFVHMDKKTGDYDKNIYESTVKYSKIYFIPRKPLYWASFSQVDIVYDLLTFAKEKGEYDYFHLLSGVDLPIKTQQYIHDFLHDKDEILMAIYPHTTTYSDDRVMYYYNFIDNKHYRNCKLLKATNLFLVILQKLVGINRLKDTNIKIYNGWDWCSFPKSFVDYLLNSRDFVYKTFRKTLCPSEIVYHTLAYNSDKFKTKIRDINNFKNSSMRLIDWERGRPYTFRKEDYDEIMASDCFFARKFDEQVDFDIVELIYNKIKKDQEQGIEMIR